LPIPKLTVAVPTLAADGALEECLRSLERQTFGDFEVVVIDNSGGSAQCPARDRAVRVMVNARNAGFGAAVNQAWRSSEAPYVAALNDDCRADARWVEALVRCADAHPRAGMFASQVRLSPRRPAEVAIEKVAPEKVALDSAGMLIAADGSGKQRGHLQPPEDFSTAVEVLFPSGSAAMYRREMLEQTGAFDEAFFLYCEDVDLGLRGRWAGWECLYVPGAIVEHRYSHSAGSASLLKAYYVERNRLYTILKNFPVRLLWRAPWAAAARYFWHAIGIPAQRGKAAEFRGQGRSAFWLPWLVFRAHAAALVRLPRLLKQRRRILRSRQIPIGKFVESMERHGIPVREVAAL
jgi:GT2 family glycosyltransferase